jgi:hypothetical protein
VQQVIQNIETLAVYNCSRLKNIVPSAAISLQKLTKLCIDHCEAIDEIVAMQVMMTVE